MHPDGDRITILIVDDHALVRDGVREILDGQDDMVVVGEASDSESAVALIGATRPDVVLLDVEIPGEGAPNTVRRILGQSPATAVVILSMFDGPQLVPRLIQAGVRGYLLKMASRQELVAAIRAVLSDKNRIVLSVSRDSLSHMSGISHTTLTDREREVLQLTAQALSNTQIASRLTLTEATVKRHLRNIFTKLGAVSRIDAVNKAVAASLIVPREAPMDRARPRGVAVRGEPD
jgi:DNA-binding NarL/FixJ family response regulator